jgi:hypothetical protein
MATNPDTRSSCPPEKVDAVSLARVLPLVDTIRANIMESRTLGATREAQLPNLLSCEIRIKDAGKFLERVV